MTLAERIASLGGESKAIKESLSLGTAPERGFSRIVSGPRFERRVAEAAKLMADVFSGRRPIWHLHEAMTTSDFPILFGNVLNRSLLGQYESYPSVWPAWCRRVVLNDFRSAEFDTIDGGNSRLGKVGERAPYPEITFTEGKYTIQVYKYGKQYGITFEMLQNDDLNAFSSRPAMMAEGARFTEDFIATSLIADASGPHASLFTAGNANKIASNPVLSITALQAAFVLLTKQRDSEGNPIFLSMVNLIVPPALEVIANNIINATEIRYTSTAGGGDTAKELISANWMKNRLRVVVNPWLPIVSLTANGDTSWYLTAAPSASRPLCMMAFLRGHESPELYLKDSNQLSLSGGATQQGVGDFDTDSIDYKCRHFMGSAQIDPKMAVSSNGSGS